jgi:hypothetical protein
VAALGGVLKMEKMGWESGCGGVWDMVVGRGVERV